MTFDKKVWKDEIAASLQGWQAKMAARKANSIYGFLAGVAFWPLLEAAEGGEFWSAVMELSSVAGGVRAKLLVEQVQGWQDWVGKSEPQVELTRWLERGAATDGKLREALDSMLLQLEVLETALAALPVESQQGLREELRKELTQLGNLTQYEALIIAGANAQGDGAIALAPYATYITGNAYYGPPPPNDEEAVRIYRQVLVTGCQELPLRGVDVGESDPTRQQKRFHLAQVYVALHTTQQRPLTFEERAAQKDARSWSRKESFPLTALQAVIENRQVVLLGAPGSGKSTFLNHFMLCLSRQAMQKQPVGVESLPEWPQKETHLLPIHVVLRDLARWLPEETSEATPKHLWAFIVAQLERQNLSFVSQPLQQALESGQAILLLDGLDEIPTRRQRTLIRDVVTCFAQRYPTCRFVVTCRTLSYQEAAWQLQGRPSFELAPFTQEQIEQFINAWYAELQRLGSVKKQEALELAQRLRQAIRQRDIRQLAPNPLLLTVMALVHTHKGRLPDARAQLYEEAVDILLWRWEQIKLGGRGEVVKLHQLLAEAKRNEVDLKRTLWRLAFQVHQTGGANEDQEALADISEWELQQSLVKLHPAQSRDWAYQVVQAIKLRAGLLVEYVPERYTFPHRTFQEYLAGCYLSSQGSFAKQATQRATEGAFWREVVLLAVGRLVYLNGDTDKPLALVGELCPRRNPQGDAAWRNVWLAGDVLREIGLNRVQDSSLGQDLLEHVQKQLVALLTSHHLSPKERAESGITLAYLGDPRPHVMTVDEMEFCYVPPSPFWMGSNDGRDDQKPFHQVDIPYGYWISRYAVTNAQFMAFVEDGGYQQERFWREAKAAGVWKDGLVRSRDRPYHYGVPFNLANHPVVGITWYEALAFTRWLAERSGSPVTLPSEAEWEKAARGGLMIPATPLIRAASTKGRRERHASFGEGEGAKGRNGNGKGHDCSAFSVPQGLTMIENPLPQRRYPWGDDFDSSYTNTKESGIGHTSAVGGFVQDKSPYGCQEMSGNVWEWTSSLYQPYPYQLDGKRENLNAPRSEVRVLRGSPLFYNSTTGTACSSRGWHDQRKLLHGLSGLSSLIHLNSGPSGLWTLISGL